MFRFLNMSNTYRMRLKSKKGFTLIELMIAVGIISVLAAFAVPSFRKYIEQAKLSEATSYLAWGAGDQMRVQMIYGKFADIIGGGASSDRPQLQIDIPKPKYDLIVGNLTGDTSANISLSRVHPQAFPTGYNIANPGLFGVNSPTNSAEANFMIGVEGSFQSNDELRFVLASTRSRRVWLLCDGHQNHNDMSAFTGVVNEWSAGNPSNIPPWFQNNLSCAVQAPSMDTGF